MLTLVLAAFALSASAQYFNTTPGQKLTYRETEAKEKVDQSYTATVLTVDTAENGVITSRVEEKHPIPGNRLSELTTYVGYSYNPADSVTTVTLMTPEDFKDLMGTSIREMASEAGQSISDSQIAELLDNAKISGSLSLPLSPSAVPDTKFVNSTLRCNMMGQMTSIRITKGLYKGSETIETPAGTFDCTKVTYLFSTPEGTVRYITEWYAPGVGLVRHIECNKKGDIQSEQILTAIEK